MLKTLKYKKSISQESEIDKKIDELQADLITKIFKHVSVSQVLLDTMVGTFKQKANMILARL